MPPAAVINCMYSPIEKALRMKGSFEDFVYPGDHAERFFRDVVRESFENLFLSHTHRTKQGKKKKNHNLQIDYFHSSPQPSDKPPQLVDRLGALQLAEAPPRPEPEPQTAEQLRDEAEGWTMVQRRKHK